MRSIVPASPLQWSPSVTACAPASSAAGGGSAVPSDNNWVENQIRSWALGRNNWLFAGSVRAGQRAANIMSLVQSAKINGLEPRRYLTRVLNAMPTARRSDLPGLSPIQPK